MYNVFIVDDETIILSGIKFLIDWEKNDCVIMNTARNGSDALEKIRAFQPDIILCDIKMPIMDGVQLLEIVHREFPSIVFIMLTNLQEFHLVREAIHNRALDYLLKNQLDAPLLEEALAKAKKEHDQRRRLMQDDKFQYYDKIRQKELVQKACLEIDTNVIQYVPRSPDIQTAEGMGGTVFECLDYSPMQDVYEQLADTILQITADSVRKITGQEKSAD